MCYLEVWVVIAQCCSWDSMMIVDGVVVAWQWMLYYTSSLLSRLRLSMQKAFDINMPSYLGREDGIFSSDFHSLHAWLDFGWLFSRRHFSSLPTVVFPYHVGGFAR